MDREDANHFRAQGEAPPLSRSGPRPAEVPALGTGTEARPSPSALQDALSLRDLGLQPVRRGADLTQRGHARPFQSKVPVKLLRFHEPVDQHLARLLEAKHQLEGGRMNDLLLRLLRRGLQAECEQAEARRQSRPAEANGPQ